MTGARARTPSARDLLWFGPILLLVFGAIGAVVLWRSESLRAALWIWSVGAVLVLAYLSLRPLRAPMYRGFMSLVAPIGWLVTRALFAVVFYGLILPIGLLRRLFRRDPLGLQPDPGRSYWARREPRPNERYFRQY